MHGFCIIYPRNFTKPFSPSNMQDLQNLDYSVLIDMLSEHTAKLTRLLAERKTDQEYEHCKEIIIKITSEIEARKKSDGNSAGTNKNSSFNQDYIQRGKDSSQ